MAEVRLEEPRAAAVMALENFMVLALELELRRVVVLLRLRFGIDEIGMVE
jgi:hypothetical protein